MTQEEKQKIKNAIARLKFWSIRYGASRSSFYEDAIKRAEITLFVAICDALSSDQSDQSNPSDKSDKYKSLRYRPHFTMENPLGLKTDH